jgi:thioredoxin-like negative regulator of GroEL
MIADRAAVQPVPVVDKPRLLFFYSRTSGPCRRVEAFLSQVLQRRHNHETFRLVRVCAEQHPDLIDHFRVDSLPTIVVVEGRRVKVRISRRLSARGFAERARRGGAQDA